MICLAAGGKERGFVVRMTIGMQLLNKMGWKEGQGIGPRVARDAGSILETNMAVGLLLE